jgi:hypothetical protein
MGFVDKLLLAYDCANARGTKVRRQGGASEVQTEVQTEVNDDLRCNVHKGFHVQSGKV